MPPSREDWQKLAAENGKLLERVTKEKPEWIPGVVASIERCNEQAALSDPASGTEKQS